MNKEYDFLFKFVIIGNSSVGKSSLLLRFSDDVFSDNYLATIGVDFWDTAGQERFRTITNAYYKGADGIIMVYASNNEQSFTDVKSFWQNEVEQYSDKSIGILLLGNKMDLEDQKISKEQAAQYASSKDYIFIQTSAKTGKNVEDAFQQLAVKLLDQKLKHLGQKIQKVNKELDTNINRYDSQNTVQLKSQKDNNNDDITNKYKDRFKEMKKKCCL